MSTKKKEVLFTYVDPVMKRWIKALCKKQAGKISQSTMVAQILTKVKNNPELIGLV